MSKMYDLSIDVTDGSHTFHGFANIDREDRFGPSVYRVRAGATRNASQVCSLDMVHPVSFGGGFVGFIRKTSAKWTVYPQVEQVMDEASGWVRMVPGDAYLTTFKTRRAAMAYAIDLALTDEGIDTPHIWGGTPLAQTNLKAVKDWRTGQRRLRKPSSGEWSPGDDRPTV